ncbi:MAG: hypothetical protein NZ761_04705, partial [Dehalococcoidia bacterium]|nr:hypothetical protein [Dehalococcoidia bacterium]
MSFTMDSSIVLRLVRHALSAGRLSEHGVLAAQRLLLALDEGRDASEVFTSWASSAESGDYSALLWECVPDLLRGVEPEQIERAIAEAGLSGGTDGHLASTLVARAHSVLALLSRTERLSEPQRTEFEEFLARCGTAELCLWLYDNLTGGFAQDDAPATEGLDAFCRLVWRVVRAMYPQALRQILIVLQEYVRYARIRRTCPTAVFVVKGRHHLVNPDGTSRVKEKWHADMTEGEMLTAVYRMLTDPFEECWEPDTPEAALRDAEEAVSEDAFGMNALASVPQEEIDKEILMHVRGEKLTVSKEAYIEPLSEWYASRIAFSVLAELSGVGEYRMKTAFATANKLREVRGVLVAEGLDTAFPGIVRLAESAHEHAARCEAVLNALSDRVRHLLREENARHRGEIFGRYRRYLWDYVQTGLPSYWRLARLAAGMRVPEAAEIAEKLHSYGLMDGLRRVVESTDGYVWFLGRDSDAFFCLARRLYGGKVRYAVGINRETRDNPTLFRIIATSLFRPQDVVVDTGFRGTILKPIERMVGCRVAMVLAEPSSRIDSMINNVDWSVCQAAREQVLRVEYLGL